MIDRVKGPTINDNFAIELPKLEHFKLANGLDIYVLDSSAQPIVKIDLCLRAGRIYEDKIAVARSTLSLMKEETTSFNTDKLSDHIDFYGAELGSSLNLDTSRISLSTIEEHLDKVLPVLVEVIAEPKFSEENLNRRKSIAAQKLANQISKNNVIAYREFSKLMFCDDHLYGYNTLPANILNVENTDLEKFYSKNIGMNNSALFLSGKITSKTRHLIFKAFDKINLNVKKHEPKAKASKFKTGIEILKQGQDQQMTLTMGAKLFNRSHPDFNYMFVFNTILGGYFSSRLMANIREEKGYCYNIYSTLECMKQDGFWYISADVGNDYIDQTSEEIRKELILLKKELVPKDELKMVKNYLQGHIMSMLDGPFSSSRVFQGAWKYKLEMDYILKFASDIKEISSEKILEMANKYCNLDNILEVRVGKGATSISNTF